MARRCADLRLGIRRARQSVGRQENRDCCVAGRARRRLHAPRRSGYTVAEALRSFELSLRYCQADYRPMFAFHTIDSNAGYSAAALQAIEQSAADYIAWLNQLTEAA